MNDHHNLEKNYREYIWKIRVRTVAHLDDWLKDYFGGLNITHEKESTTLISGELPDLPDVYGLILKLRDSGIELVSLQVERLLKKGR